MKEKWTESEVLSFPLDEHNAVERKAGRLLEHPQEFRENVARALSALANSGGGHLILGQENDGTFDGLPPKQGRTTIREWLEQTLPRLVSYPLEAIRVYTVLKESASQIPEGREAIVVEVGDSRLAPHQTCFPADAPQYYYRQAGKSVLAPHHYLEALRNRMTFAVLEAQLEAAGLANGHRDGTQILIDMWVRFSVRNVSRVACYHWSVSCSTSTTGAGRESGVSVARAILPTCSDKKTDTIRFIFPDNRRIGAWGRAKLISDTEVQYHTIAETHLGELRATILLGVLQGPPDGFEQLLQEIKNRGLGD